MDTKVKTWLGVVVIIILVTTVGVIAWKIVKFKQIANAPAPAQIQAPNQVAEKQKVETASQKTYANDQYNFKLQVPQNFQWNVQDQSAEGLYDINFSTDKTAESSMDLNINSNDWVKKIKNPGVEIKAYVSNSGFGANNADATLTSWAEENTKDSQTIYFYNLEVKDSSKTKVSGAIWLVAGKMFDLRNIKNDDQELLKNMALGFSVNNQTADWQTYRNEKYGFEFQYPKEWISEKWDTSPDQIVGISTKKEHDLNENLLTNKVAQDSPISAIDVEYNETLLDNSEVKAMGAKDLESFVKNYKKYKDLPNLPWNPEKINFAGENGWLTSFYGQNNIFVVHNNHLFSFLFNESAYWERGKQEMPEIVNNFISTFKFIN